MLNCLLVRLETQHVDCFCDLSSIRSQVLHVVSPVVIRVNWPDRVVLH